MGRPAVRRPSRRVVLAALVVLGVVAVVVARARGEDPGLRLSVGPVTRTAPAPATAAAGTARAAAPAPERRVSPPAPQEPRAPRRHAARPSPAPAAPPSASAAGPVGRSGPPQAGTPLPGPSRPVPAPPAPAPASTPAAPAPAPAPAPARTPPPQRTFSVDRTDVRMSPLNATGAVRADLARFTPLPGPGRPYATYLGRVTGRRAAAFVVTPGTSVLGGDCRPSRSQCAVVVVAAGRHAWVGFGDGTAWRLDVLAVDRLSVASRAEARAARARASAAGACALARLHVMPDVLPALGVDLAVAPAPGQFAC